MLKTKEELNQLKKEYESLNAKLKELTDDELKIVIGGANWYGIDNSDGQFEPGSRLVNNTKQQDEQIINK